MKKWKVKPRRESHDGFTVSDPDGQINGYNDSDLYMHVLDIPDDAVGAIKAGQSLFQAQKGEIHGAVTILGNERVRLDLFQTAKPHTAIHELGHAFMYDLEGDDLVTVEGFVGAKFNEWDKGHHEKWAKAVERYTLTGRSPTVALKQVFAKLKEWMSLVYKSVDELGTPITPELRELLDRRFGYQGRTPEDIVKYAGEHWATAERYGAISSNAKDKVQRLEKAHARKAARRDLEGMRARRTELVAARRKTGGEVTGLNLDEQIAQLDEQIARREVIAEAASERREKALDSRSQRLERVIEAMDKHPEAKGKQSALEAARYLSEWTEEILLEAFGDERQGQFEARRALLSGHSRRPGAARGRLSLPDARRPPLAELRDARARSLHAVHAARTSARPGRPI